MSGNDKPQVTYRAGAISASVWQNKPEGRRPFHTVRVQRSYRDGEDTKYSDSFTLGDLANVQRVLAKAQEYVEGEDMVVS